MSCVLCRCRVYSPVHVYSLHAERADQTLAFEKYKCVWLIFATGQFHSPLLMHL